MLTRCLERHGMAKVADLNMVQCHLGYAPLTLTATAAPMNLKSFSSLPTIVAMYPVTFHSFTI